jgi:hypothetical protein
MKSWHCKNHLALFVGGKRTSFGRPLAFCAGILVQLGYQFFIDNCVPTAGVKKNPKSSEMFAFSTALPGM